MNYDKLADLILEEVGGYKPVKLPYAFNALEPYIDEETMKLHYNKHYKGYVKNTVYDLLGGLRSTCTYVGAPTLKQLSKCTTFIRCTQQFNPVFTGE